MNTGTVDNHRRRASIALITAMGLLAAVVLAIPAVAGAAAAEVPSVASDLTVEQAIAEAQRTGKAVDATAATTDRETIRANPDGTITLSQSASAIRKKINGKWQDLDATLEPNSDGTWSPKVSQAPLKISPGGGSTAPMAVIGQPGLNATIDAPMKLPPATISGATATYIGVLPGVDLEVTARPSLGLSLECRSIVIVR
ncbi:hypothetical protein [Actinoplanes xinjiangensis]|uniref:hypothetical protein n=1 Tax=Actinoplanes xinjiangensis TaxID=512350 RepID=UPI003444F966